MTPTTPRFRVEPEDFQVTEIPLFEPLGEGGHTYVQIEKRLRNSEDVAQLLARAAGVSPRDVGYAGRKDRNAVTIQWYSIPDWAPEDALAFGESGLRVLQAIPHAHKLRTGQLRGNRFELRVHDVDAATGASAEEALAEIAQRGLPNRFGDQRFGREGANVARARAMVEGRLNVRDRRKARFLYSALQSYAFNRVLDERPLPIDQLELGDVAQVVESGGLFVVEDLERESERVARFEISPTGPIVGSKMTKPQGGVAIREGVILAECGFIGDPPTPPRGVRARGGRRPLRVPVGEVAFEVVDEIASLKFALPAGSYATELLARVFGSLEADATE